MHFVIGFVLIICICYILCILCIHQNDLNTCRYPSIIFQTWKSTTDIPPNMKYWHNTWKEYNPTYDHVLWDDTLNRNFIDKHFNWFLEIYDSYDKNIQRADAIRYFFLYMYGGIYADMDFECLQNFDSLFDMYQSDSDVLLGHMDTNDIFNSHSVPNAIMISKPRQEFWLCVFYQLIQKSQDSLVEGATGPIMLKEAFELYEKTKNNKVREWYDIIIQKLDPEYYPVPHEKTKILLLPSKLLYPLSWSTQQDERLEALDNRDYSNQTKRSKEKYPEAYAVTYWTHTW